MLRASTNITNRKTSVKTNNRRTLIKKSKKARHVYGPKQYAISVVTKHTYHSEPHPHYILRCRVGDRNVEIECTAEQAKKFPVGFHLPVIYQVAKLDRYQLKGVIDTDQLRQPL